MNRNMIQWLLWLVCVFVIVGEVLGCPPPGEPPTATINSDNPNYEFNATGVKMIFIGSASDDGCIMNRKWEFPSGMTLVEEGLASCKSCGTGCLEDGDEGLCYKTSCTFGSTGKYTITLTVTDDDGLTGSATCDVYISNVVSVEWVKFHSSNLNINVHPGVPTNGGKRIFPGKMVYDDELAEIRRMVHAKVTISNTFTDMPETGFPIRLMLYDVDDPSANDSGLSEAQCTAPLDCDDESHSEFRSYEDNRGEGEFPFYFPSSGNTNLTTAHVLNGNNYVNETVGVSLQPGDNVRSVASTTLDSEVWGEVTLYFVDFFPSALPGQVERSDMLTVWRKLHIEQDSYDRPGWAGGQTNCITGTAVGYTWNPGMGLLGATIVDLGNALSGEFGEENQFFYGRYVVGGTTYHVSGSHNDFVWPYHDTITIFGTNLTAPPPGVALGPYTLYDDDEGVFTGNPATWTLTDVVPAYPTLDTTWETALAKAYIAPDYLLWSDQVPFKRHLSTDDVGTGDGLWNDYHQRTTEVRFWTTFVFSAFQGDTDRDCDPDGGTVVLGAERAGVFADKTECVLYLETIRDAFKDVGQVMLHELGHTGGCEDNECVDGCIMQKDVNGNIGNHFCEKCLYELRHEEEWGE